MALKRMQERMDPQNLLRKEAGWQREVKPRRGRLVVFFTRADDGEEDQLSWHGGASVADAEKWTVQIFKEVPVVAFTW